MKESAVKVKYDELLAKAIIDDAKYFGIEVSKNGLKNNKLHGNLNILAVWSGNHIALTMIILNEAALVNDYGKRIAYELEALGTDKERLDHSEQIIASTSPPDYVACECTTIPLEIIEYARSRRNNVAPFNFMNPSGVNAAWTKGQGSWPR